jgi:hypothetical protein
MNNSKEALSFDSLLGRIVDAFNKKNISFCILRNSDISWTNGDDIDVLLYHLDLDSAVSEISNIISSIKYASLMFDKQVDFHRHLFIIFYDELTNENKMLVIDLQVGIIENDTVFFLADDVLIYKKETELIPRLDSSMEGLLMLIHSIFGKRKFNRNYWEILVRINSDNSKKLFNVLLLVFKESISLLIIESLKSNDQLSILSISHTDLVPQIVRKKNSRLFARLFKRIRWLLIPPGKLICFEGKFDLNIKKELLRLLELSPYVSSELPIEITREQDLNNEKNEQNYLIKRFFSNIKKLYNSVIYFLRIRKRLSKNEIVISHNYLSDNLILYDMINNKKITLMNKKIIDYIFLVVLFDDNNLFKNNKQVRYMEVRSNYSKKASIYSILSRMF